MYDNLEYNNSTSDKWALEKFIILVVCHYFIAYTKINYLWIKELNVKKNYRIEEYICKYLISLKLEKGVSKCKSK